MRLSRESNCLLFRFLLKRLPPASLDRVNVGLTRSQGVPISGWSSRGASLELAMRAEIVKETEKKEKERNVKCGNENDLERIPHSNQRTIE